MKRTVKAWALFWKGKPKFYPGAPFWAAFPNRGAARRNAFPENVVRVVTITFEDGRNEPRRRKR